MQNLNAIGSVQCIPYTFEWSVYNKRQVSSESLQISHKSLTLNVNKAIDTSTFSGFHLYPNCAFCFSFVICVGITFE